MHTLSHPTQHRLTDRLAAGLAFLILMAWFVVLFGLGLAMLEHVSEKLMKTQNGHAVAVSTHGQPGALPLE